MAPDKKKDKRGKDDATPAPLVGVYIFPNGDEYDGEYRQLEDGSIERHGQGTHRVTDGTTYTGQWIDDKMTGYGKLKHANAAFYEGDFQDNKLHGKGVYTWPNGSSYEGNFIENRFEGDGQFTDTEGQVWVGQFRHKAAPGLKFKLNL